MTEDYKPQSAFEQYMKNILLKKGTSDLPKPQSRMEELLLELCELLSNEVFQGPPGPKGDPGKSAYQLAIEGGYKGTQEEWIASLRGPQGPKGNPGQDGQNGPPGNDGKTPEKGVDYWTEADKAEINAYIDAKIAEKLPPSS